jgi:hypothetical protein
MSSTSHADETLQALKQLLYQRKHEEVKLGLPSQFTTAPACAQVLKSKPFKSVDVNLPVAFRGLTVDDIILVIANMLTSGCSYY